MSESLLQEECDRNLEKLGLKQLPVAPVMPSVTAPVAPVEAKLNEPSAIASEQEVLQQPGGPTPYDGMKIAIGHGDQTAFLYQGE